MPIVKPNPNVVVDNVVPPPVKVEVEFKDMEILFLILFFKAEALV